MNLLYNQRRWLNNCYARWKGSNKSPSGRSSFLPPTQFVAQSLLLFGIAALSMFSVTATYAQSVLAGSGAPATAFQVANGAKTFTVTVAGGSNPSGSVAITLPTGYIIDRTSIVGVGGLTAALASASGNTATVNLTGIPAAGTNGTFTYRAYATCAAIGVNANTASYVYTPSGGTAMAAVESNSFNLQNAKLNITNLNNLPASPGLVGDYYTRSYRINNNGFGAIDTVYVTDVTGNGVGYVSNSVTSTNLGADVSVSLLSTTPGANTTTRVYRFIINKSGASENHFQQNDYFTFTQELQIVNCNNLNTTINAWYGLSPNPEVCVGQNSTQTTGLAVNNSGQPNLELKVNPSSSGVSQVNKQLTCRGTAEEQFYTVKNVGTGKATNVTLQMVHVWGIVNATPNVSAIPADQVAFLLSSFKYKISSSATPPALNEYEPLTVGGSGIRIENVHQYNTPAACFDSDNPSWLEVFVPELAPGETLYITYQDKNCCDTECKDRRVFSTLVTQRYYNQCGVVAKNTIGGASDMLRNAGLGQTSLTEIFPTDISEGQSYTFKWDVLQTFFAEEFYPVGSSQTYEITLPAGLVYDGTSPITMLTKTGASATPSNVSVAGNVISVTFTTGVGGFLARDYNQKGVLNIPGISLDCETGGGAGERVVETKVFYKSINCGAGGCSEQVVCNTKSVKYHCSIPCDEGLQFTGFDVRRTTYGSPDNDNNGIADTGGAIGPNVRTNWATKGDLIDFTFTGTVKNIVAHTDFQFAYANFTVPDNGARDDLAGVSARVRITNADGSVIKADISNFPLTYSTASGIAKVDFSIAQLAGYGYTSFEAGDKFVITSTLQVTGGIPGMFISSIVATDFYLSKVPNVDGSQPKFTCDNYSGEFTLVGLVGTVKTASTVIARECAEFILRGDAGFNVGEGVNNGGFGVNHFAFEHRQLGVPGNFTFKMPAGHSLSNMKFYYRRTTSNYASVEEVHINGATPTSINGDTYVYNIRNYFKDRGGLWELPDEGFTVYFEATFSPTCEAPAAGKLDYAMEILPGVDMPAGTVFPHTPGVNSQTDLLVEGTVNITLSKASLVVNSNSNTKTVTGNSVTWDIQVSNTIANTSPKVWFAENDIPTNGITIESIERISGFGAAATGTVSANGNGIYELGSFGQESRYYRITASFTNCGEDTLPLAYGYVCNDYPSSVQEAACKNLLDFKVIPTDASLQVSLVSQPTPTYPDADNPATGTMDLCEELEYVAEVKNPAQGTAYNLTFTVNKPAGMSYIANSYELSHTLLPTAATLVAVNNDATYVSETATTITFTIPTSVLSQLTYNDGYTIRYKVKTNACDFISRTGMAVQAFGTNGCGSAVVGTKQQTQSIRIEGENLNPNTYVITSSVSDPIAACIESPAPTYTFTAINSGPSQTNSGETIRVSVPKPFTLGTVTNISNLTSGMVPVIESDATTTTYIWTMPAGINPGATISFSAPLEISSTDLQTIACGETLPIHEMIAFMFTATCVSDGSICSGNLQSEGENQTTTINVVKPGLAVESFTATSNPTTGEVAGTVTVTNSNSTTATVAQTGTLKLYFDTNGNGIVDAGDQELGSQTLSLSTAATETLSYSITTSYRGDICPMIAEVTVGCACSTVFTQQLACNISLPVRLESFEVRKSENAHRLEWATTLEMNSSIFEVQRSADGKEWYVLGTVKASGNSDQVKRYSYSDYAPAKGLNYYRLRMIDLDNTFNYSIIRSIASDGNNNLFYPNPVIDRLNLNVGNISEVASIQVINLNGNTVMTLKKPSQSVIEMNTLDTGIYLIRVTYHSGLVLDQKVIKK